jgi:hypothetical protein
MSRTKQTQTDIADVLLAVPDNPPPPPAPKSVAWHEEIISAVRLLKDATYRLRRLAEQVPAGQAEAAELMAGSLKVLNELGVRPNLIDPVADARNTGAGVAGMMSGSMADAFGTLAASLMAAVNDSLTRGANDPADPLIRPADFGANLLRSTAGSPFVFVPESAIPADHPLRRLPCLYLTGGVRVACLGSPGRKLVRLSEVQEMTSALEDQRQRREKDAAREKELRDAEAARLDEQVNAAFLKNRIRELEAKLAGQ